MKKIIFILIITGACEFRMDDADAQEELETYAEIYFGDLELGDRNMHYAFTNQGRSKMLIFIHGSPGSWSAFIDFFKADSILNDYDVLAIDRPGFGLSGFGDVEQSLEVQAYQINEVVKQFSHTQKILVGHSLGGSVIARMAMDYPLFYSGLIFVAPSIDPDMEKDEWYRKIIDTQVGAFFTPKEFEVSNSEIITLKAELIEMLPLWEKIISPAVVIQGTDDMLVPKENADFAERMLKDSITTITLLEGENHFIPWSHPREIIKAVYTLENRSEN